MPRPRLIGLSAFLLSAAAARAQVAIIELPEAAKMAVRTEEERYAGITREATLVVFLIRDGSHGGARPIDAPFFDDPQPIFSRNLDASSVNNHETIELWGSTEGFTGKAYTELKQMRGGKFRVQAALIISRAEGGDWKLTPGNWYSEVATLELPEELPESGGIEKPVRLKLTRRTQARQWPADVRGVELFAMKSKLLSDFAGRDVWMRAGVRLPTKMSDDPSRRYAAIYHVPGFGGDHFGALFPHLQATAEDRVISEQVFQITLDPNNENGHTLFVDSETNGPWGEALTKELIPALEAKYPMMARPGARLLRGHSSGGWSTLWLATEYPAVFGATWSSSPDPVDFRCLERVDIYSEPNMFVDKAGKERPSKRSRGAYGEDVTDMTIRQENAVEQALGPFRKSGQQWASWQACWGGKGMPGHPGELFNPFQGEIHTEAAEGYRKFDLADRLRKDPARLVPIYRERVRLIVGTKDDYYLNEAVELLEADLKRLAGDVPQGPGYIRYVDRADHSTVYRSMAIIQIGKEMVEHLRVKADGAIR